MLNVDRVWSRQAAKWPGKKLSDFRLQVVTGTFNVAASSASQNNPVSFGAGAIIVGVIAAASVQNQGSAATVTYRPGLDLFTTTISYQADNRVIVGTAEALGSSVFGPYGDQYPGMEIPMPQNTALLYNFTNQTTTAITITLAHHCLMLGAVY
jgi:hypothetical protein